MADSNPSLADRRRRLQMVAMIPAGIALNLGLGMVPYLLKIPFLYLDAVGTIACTLLLGWRVGLAVGVGSFLIGGIWNPALPWFIGTQAIIALYTYVLGKYGCFARRPWLLAGLPGKLLGWLRPVLAGIGLGVVAGIVSAPVIVLVFGGITGSGPSVVVAVLLRTGRQLLESVLLSGLAAEPVDKTIQLLLALALLRTLPRNIKTIADGVLLQKNELLVERDG